MTTYRYQDSANVGDLTAKVDPDGNVWNYLYDQYGDRIQTIDLQVFLSQGIDPTAKSVLVVKSVQHFLAAYGPIAREIVWVDSGGICSPDISRLKFKKLRRPIWPLDGVNDPFSSLPPA